MQFPIFAAIMAVAVSAAPSGDVEARASPVTGSNTPGSIFQFGSDANCNAIFRKSGACGISTYFKNTPKDAALIALPSHYFDAHGASDQTNKLCGKTITMTHNGVTRKAIVADENTSNEQSIDMCLSMWQAFGGHDNDGTLIKPFSWSIAV